MGKNKNIIVAAIAIILAVIAVALIYHRIRDSRTQANIGEFNLLVMPQDDFNEKVAESLGKDAITWKDINKDSTFILPDGSVDIKELSGKKVKKYTVKSKGLYYFSKSFEALYSPLLEKTRQEKVSTELDLARIVPIETDIIARLKQFPNLGAEEIALYRDGIAKLMELAPVMKLLYQEQLGTGPDDRIGAATDDDRELFDRYEQPWCLSDTSRLCVALPSFKERTSNVISPDIPCNKACDASSPFETASKGDGETILATPYNTVWAKELGKASTILNEAAAIFEKIPREAKFAKSLRDEAEAFLNPEPYPYSESDSSWNEALTSDSIMFIRTGPDEVGGNGVGDSCECKARFHFNLGIKSSGAKEIVEKLRPAIQTIEERFADLIGDPKKYQATEIQVQLPVFLDVIYANGDDIGGPGGVIVGQTLPNWCGKDGKGECMHGTMIYSNKTIKAVNKPIIKKYIAPLFSPKLEKYLGSEQAALDSIVYHEIFHNIGPRIKKKRPNSETTFGEHMISSNGIPWGLPLEELKAQTGSIYLANIFYQDLLDKREKGLIDEKTFEEEKQKYLTHITYDITWGLVMILKGSKSGPEFSSRSPYSKLATVQIGFLTEQGAISFDEKTKQWSIDFEKIPAATDALMKKTGELYVSASADDIEKFFMYYMRGDGEKLLHRDRLVEVAGKMPSTLFNYQLKGL